MLYGVFIYFIPSRKGVDNSHSVSLNSDAISNIKPGSVTYVKSFDIENGLNVIDLSKIL